MSAVATALSVIERTAVLCWLATVDGGGQPHVSPKEVFSVIGSHRLAIAHIASPSSVSNIARNPRVCVSFVDVFVQKGWKLLGTAEVIRADSSGFETLAAPLIRQAGSSFSVLAAIVIEVEKAVPILAPSYRRHGDSPTQERLQVRQARGRYLGLLRAHARNDSNYP